MLSHTKGRKILLAVPQDMLQELDYIASVEHRTRSDLFREALRRYSRDFKLQNKILLPANPVPAAPSSPELVCA